VAQPCPVFGYILDLLGYGRSFRLDYGALLLWDGGIAGVYLDFGDFDQFVEARACGLRGVYGVRRIKMVGRLAVLRQ
jgi:hypothetical protein